MRQRILVLMAGLAILAACGSKEPSGVDAEGLIAKLKSADPEVRGPAGSALRDMGEPAVPALAVALADPDAQVRERIATVLWGMGPRAAAAVPTLSFTLTDSDASVRAAAAMALETIGPPAREAVPELIKAVRDPEPKVRIRAVTALGKIGPAASAAVPVLTLVTKDEALRLAAEQSLREIGRQ